MSAVNTASDTVITVNITRRCYGTSREDAEKYIDNVVITDTIPLPASHHLQRIKVLSVAPLIGEAITRIHQGKSVGALFSSEMQRTQSMLLWGEDDEEPA